MKLSAFLSSLASGLPISGVYETTCTATCTGITEKWVHSPVTAWGINGLKTTGKAKDLYTSLAFNSRFKLTLATAI